MLHWVKLLECGDQRPVAPNTRTLKAGSEDLALENIGRSWRFVGL